MTPAHINKIKLMILMMLENIMIIAVTIMIMPQILGFLSVFSAAKAEIIDAIKAGIYIIYIA